MEDYLEENRRLDYWKIFLNSINNKIIINNNDFIVNRIKKTILTINSINNKL